MNNQPERKGMHLTLPPLPIWKFEGTFTPPPGAVGDNSTDGAMPHDEASPTPAGSDPKEKEVE